MIQWGMTCPDDKLVLSQHAVRRLPLPGERYFGSMKQGKFICERYADKEGDRSTHSGQ
jgi:hypothetical protein